MRHTYLFLLIIVVVSGCGTVVSTDESLVTFTDSTALEVQKNGYRNTRFGYGFDVPEGLVVYALTDSQTAVAASEDSEVVFLVDGETNFFTVRGIEDSRTPHEWLTENLLFFYPIGDAAQRVGEFAGAQAIFLRGSGTPTSPAQLIVCSLEGKLIVVSYEQETPTFQSLVESFTSI